MYILLTLLICVIISTMCISARNFFTNHKPYTVMQHTVGLQIVSSMTMVSYEFTEISAVKELLL